MKDTAHSPPDITQARLLILAASFVVLYALALTLSPAARLRTWQVDYRWSHWLAVAAWLGVFGVTHWQTKRVLPDRDPYLLPIAGLLSGWGILTIYRLYPEFGLRQTFWLLLAGAVLTLGQRLPSILNILRQYKYVWLTLGLVLTGLTLLFGTNPLGDGPRLWLGCCNFYFQPSEPLKLLLVVYLSAYLSTQYGQGIVLPRSTRFAAAVDLLAMLAPTLLMIGISLALLLVQRDLGTASIFIFLYTAITYVSTGRRRILLISLLTLIVSGLVGYTLYELVRLRVDAWLNPWLDPSGRSFQIVQSLLSIANGGILGRGPGLGSPSLVPVAHSDFIFSAMVEEGGLAAGLGLITLIGLFLNRGISIALRSRDRFAGLLAFGLTVYMGAQSILIIAGNLRLLPLTGVTLPLVSYGGSSLLTSYFALLLLLHISNTQTETITTSRNTSRHMLSISSLSLAALGLLALAIGWWTVYRGPTLLTRTDNLRRTIDDRYVIRGAVLDRANNPLSQTSGIVGSYQRQYLHPALSPILGYTHPVYGQAGLEASLDPYLRGLQGNPGVAIWMQHLIYGQPPPGLDVRLSLDLDLQQAADQFLENTRGALVLMDAESGELYVMSSHPSYDANQLDQTWSVLISDADAPLLNRATQGLYLPGTILGPFLLTEAMQSGRTLPDLPSILPVRIDDQILECSLTPESQGDWGLQVQSGCPGALLELADQVAPSSVTDLQTIYDKFRLYSPPEIRLPIPATAPPDPQADRKLAALGQADLRISPMQLVVAGATLSNHGRVPAARLAVAVNTPQSGWVVLSAVGNENQILEASVADDTADMLAVSGKPFWQSVATAYYEDESITWVLAGTLPEWSGSPLVLALLLEENNPTLAQQIAQAVLEKSLALP